MRLNRRTFLMSSTAIILAPVAWAQDTTPADTIYSGGPILTMDDTLPRAEAVAVADGRIIAVGSMADVMAHKGDATRMVDLGGRAMLPGFVDPHGHVVMGGLQAASANLLAPPDGEVTDIPSLIATMNAWAEANQDIVTSVNIIMGFGYDQSQLAEYRAPTKEELDTISATVPVLLVHQSGHMCALNSVALAMLGIDATTPNPPGGVIQRVDGSDEPYGVLEEAAFFPALPKLLGNVGPEAAKSMAIAGTELWASFGYTTAQEGRSSPAVDAILRAINADGSLKIDVVAFGDFLSDQSYFNDNVSATYDNHFRLGGLKLTIDGSPQGFTAWRDRPYFDPVGNFEAGYLGYPAVTREQAFDAIDRAYANNMQILVHANGEAAIDLLIAALQQAEDKHGKGDRRPVLIHGQFQRPDQVAAIVRLGVFPSLFPMHTFYWGDWHRDHTVGPELADNISPTGWYRDRGSMFTTHSDAPVAFPDTMRVLDATVTRRSRSGDILGPMQRVDVETALKAMTIWAAYEVFEDDHKGSITPGKLADFVILSDDPTAVDPETLDQLLVTETVKEDVTIFVRGQKRADLIRPRDFGNESLFALFRALFVHQRMDRLPPAYQTAEARTLIEQGYDDCAATLVLPWLFGLPSSGQGVALDATGPANRG